MFAHINSTARSHISQIGCFIFLTATGFLRVAMAAPDNFTEEAWQIKSASYGCKSKDDYSKLIGLIASGDDAAALKFVTPRTLAGTCKILQPSKVFLEDASLFGNPCVRKRGEPDCFYTARRNIEPVK